VQHVAAVSASAVSALPKPGTVQQQAVQSGAAVTEPTAHVTAMPEVNVESLRSLADLGIDVSFLEDFGTSSRTYCCTRC
jgi:hypothetical protein